MICQHCGGDSRVLETNSYRVDGSVRRIRQCLECGTRFATIEREVPDDEYNIQHRYSKKSIKRFLDVALKRY